MKTKSTKAVKQSSHKKTTRKNASVLSTCSVGGAGWCAYPFSIAQLQKRIKHITEQAHTVDELATTGSGTDAGKSR